MSATTSPAMRLRPRRPVTARSAFCAASRVTSPMVEATYLPVMCNHCDDAPCVRAGSGAVRKREDGIVIIDPEKARGRKDIVASCPDKAIVWNEERQLPQAWIFDAHLLDQGWSRPRCQQACPPRRLRNCETRRPRHGGKGGAGGTRSAAAEGGDQAPVSGTGGWSVGRPASSAAASARGSMGS